MNKSGTDPQVIAHPKGGGAIKGLGESYAAAPPFPLNDPEVRLLDLDGDGVTDALRTGARFEIYFHDRKLGWNRVETRTRRVRLALTRRRRPC